MYIYNYIYTNLFIYAYMSVNIYIYMYIYMCVHTYIYIHIINVVNIIFNQLSSQPLTPGSSQHLAQDVKAPQANVALQVPTFTEGLEGRNLGFLW